MSQRHSAARRKRDRKRDGHKKPVLSVAEVEWLAAPREPAVREEPGRCAKCAAAGRAWCKCPGTPRIIPPATPDRAAQYRKLLREVRRDLSGPLLADWEDMIDALLRADEHEAASRKRPAQKEYHAATRALARIQAQVPVSSRRAAADG